MRLSTVPRSCSRIWPAYIRGESCRPTPSSLAPKGFLCFMHTRRFAGESIPQIITTFTEIPRDARRRKKKGVRLPSANGYSHGFRQFSTISPAAPILLACFDLPGSRRKPHLSARTHPRSCSFGQRSGLIGVGWKSNFVVCTRVGVRAIQPNPARDCQNGACGECCTWRPENMRSPPGRLACPGISIGQYQ